MVFLVVIFFMSVSFAPLSASQREAYRIPPRRPAFSYHLRGSILRSFGWGSAALWGRQSCLQPPFRRLFRTCASLLSPQAPGRRQPGLAAPQSGGAATKKLFPKPGGRKKHSSPVLPPRSGARLSFTPFPVLTHWASI